MWQDIQTTSLTTSFVKLCLGSGWWPYCLVMISRSVPSVPWDWYCWHLRGLLGGFLSSCIWFLVQGRTSKLHSSRWISSFKVVFWPKSFQWRCSLLDTSCAEVQQQLLKKKWSVRTRLFQEFKKLSKNSPAPTHWEMQYYTIASMLGGTVIKRWNRKVQSIQSVLFLPDCLPHNACSTVSRALHFMFLPAAKAGTGRWEQETCVLFGQKLVFSFCSVEKRQASLSYFCDFVRCRQ